MQQEPPSRTEPSLAENDSAAGRDPFFLKYPPGRIQKLLAYVLYCVILVIIYGHLDSPGPIALIVVGIGAGMLHRSGNRCLVYERKLIAASSPPAEDKSRPVILYLRSFDADKTAAEALMSDPIYAGTSTYHPPQIISYISEEEQLAAVMNEFGCFRAIGRPNEKLPELGASREYVKGEWQDRVRALMQRSILVVVRIGATQGLLWELNTAIEHVAPARLLLLIGFGRDEYLSFQDEHGHRFPKGLPTYCGGPRLGSLQGIVSFQPDWTPEFITLEKNYIYTPSTPLQSALKLSLMPILDRLNIPYAPLKLAPVILLRWPFMAMWSLFALLVAFMAMGWISIIVLGFFLIGAFALLDEVRMHLNARKRAKNSQRATHVTVKSEALETIDNGCDSK